MKKGFCLDDVRDILQKQSYAFAGRHSAVQICRWTKNSLNGNGVCWKEKFYGVESHRCCQFSPSIMWCENFCLHCWRPIEMNLGKKLDDIDEPEKILDEIIEKRKKLLMGFKGNEKVSRKRFYESINPNLFTFSLSGEPTLYPYLAEMIDVIRKRNAISFLVTNGLNPKAIKTLERKNSLPTQLTVSCLPNEELFLKWTRTLKKNAWKNFLETLDLVRKLKGKTRRALRITLVKKGKEKSKYKDIENMSDENIQNYSEIIKRAEPDFVHIVGFKSVGYSRERMGYGKQPWHCEVKDFAEKLAGKLGGYKIMGEEPRSAAVLLSNLPKEKLKIKAKI